MKRANFSKLDKWSAKYGALAIALSCLISAINSWGDNWILTSVLLLGVLVCGMISFFDVKRSKTEEL